MRGKQFNDYMKAVRFCDNVDGQIQWCSDKGKDYWIVWY